MPQRSNRTPEELAQFRERDRVDNHRARIHHTAHMLRETPHHFTDAHRREHTATVSEYLGRHVAGATPEDIAREAQRAAEQRGPELERHAKEMEALTREACAAEQVERPEDLSAPAQEVLIDHLGKARARHDVTIAELDAAELPHQETELLASIPDT